MKKTLLIVLALVLCAAPAKADEGMWLLPLLKQFNAKGMKEAGLKLTPEDIYSINHSSIKDAIVIFGGGCTGEVVSNEGLLLTNHHCGYGTIQALSSMEHNYLKDGFWAKSKAEEIPSPGLSVTFLESVTDVTKAVNKVLDTCSTEASRQEALNKLTLQYSQKTGDNPYVRGLLSSLYGGNTFYYFVYKIYTDIRFVGAPPSSIGKFGADTDNWMWPRHTCDFSMFRIYAGPNNEPAAYSENNRPYTPAHSLPVSLKGVNEGDFVMTLGYPGTTTRYMSAIEVDRQEQLINHIGVEVRTLRQNILLEDMLADPKVQLQYASKYSGSSNAWKKWMGMTETFNKLGVKERRLQQERDFTQWVSKDKKRLAKYGTALQDIEESVKGQWDAYYVSRYLSETLRNIEVASFAARFFTRRTRPGEDPQPYTAEALQAQAQRFFANYNAPTDVKVAKAMLKHYASKVDASALPSVYNIINERFGGNVDAYVDSLFGATLFANPTKLNAFIEELCAQGANQDALVERVTKEDPAIVLGQSINEAAIAFNAKTQPFQAQYNKGHRNYIGGLLEMRKGQAIYPDANFTMRLTYGNVMGYQPKDGVVYNHYTTLTGVMEKEDPNNWEFVVPQKLKDLYKAKDYGPYAQPGEEVVTGFIANTDITGGNSGSPVLNAYGELIGLAFDGNWESMSSDVIFEPNLQRCIAVDIRYVLFIIDKYGEAGYLLNEMDIRK